MKTLRRVRLAVAVACLCAACAQLVCAQAQSAQSSGQGAAAQQPAQPSQQPQRPPSPFEEVPRAAPPPPPPAREAPPAAQPQPQAEPPAPAAEEPAQPPTEAPPQIQIPPQAAGQYVEAVEFRGARRVPQDTLRALISTKPGDLYDEESLRRDFMTLWNSGRFDDIRLEVEPGRTALLVRYVVTERRVVRAIEYAGIHSVTQSEILDRFKERKVGLTVESQYDPNKVQRAVVVLKAFLAERGHGYANVDPVLEQMPPSALKITFRVNEGPKVKIGEINIDGNQAYKKRWIVANMKLSKPYGVPHSILFENLFAKTYDQEKLEYDTEMIRQAYLDAGYFQAKVEVEKVNIVVKGGSGWRLPIIKMNQAGIHANVNLRVEEGRQYRLRNINFQGFKLFKTPESLMLPVFRMDKGDVFSAEKLRKGLEQMRKLYGVYGFMDFVPEPNFDFIPDTNQVDLTLTADEGKQFFIRRIDFSGNTTTRDKVIRREILLDEGDMFNMDLWEMSILRLNQLGYFEMLKKEDAADIKRNPNSNTVDITLKVKERGKNTIGMNGGVSGIAGSFLGFNYSTNNFLGLGETLSIDSQIGTRMKDVSFGFTEPYLFDHPIQAGFVVYLRSFNFDQAREASILAGQDLVSLYQGLGTNNLLNYSQNSKGFSVSASTHLRRTFAQIGMTYGYDNSTIETQTNAAANYFQYMNFSGVSGPNSLNGIRTSSITPSYSYNTVNHPLFPTAGRSLYLSTQFAGSILGGNVNTLSPALDAKYFRASPFGRSHVLAFHLTASLITGFGGKVAPPYSRRFIGGEQDIRGFENWGVTPMAFIPSSATVSVLNADGSNRTQRTIQNGVSANTNVSMTVPSYQLITPGGDGQMVLNFEYRIPIIGTTVQLAPFLDAGVNKILITNQLKMEATHIADLNAQFPQAGFGEKVRIVPGTQKPRVSTGVELQVMLPIVQAPFRVYWAYNPSVVQQYLQPPIVVDRTAFPNDATFLNAILSSGVGQSYPFYEKRSVFRFTIGKTF